MFLFSGPNSATSPLQVEKEACLQMIKSLRDNDAMQGKKIMLSTDSYWLKKEMEFLLLEMSFFINLPFYLSISQCDRDILGEADFLAKNGSHLKFIRQEWN